VPYPILSTIRLISTLLMVCSGITMSETNSKRGKKKRSKGHAAEPPDLTEISVEEVEIFEDAEEGNDNEAEQQHRLPALNLSVQGAGFLNSESTSLRCQVNATDIDLSDLSLTNSAKEDQNDLVEITQPFLEATKGMCMV